MDYLDQYLLGALDADDPFSGPVVQLDDAVDEVIKLRAEVKVRAVAFSVHDPDYAVRLLERYPAFDAVMTPTALQPQGGRQPAGPVSGVLRGRGVKARHIR